MKKRIIFLGSCVEHVNYNLIINHTFLNAQSMEYLEIIFQLLSILITWYV